MNKRSCEQDKVEPDGILFITCSDGSYKSLNYHRSASGTKKRKACWVVSVRDECHCFCESEISSWIDASGNHWFISKDALKVLGDCQERVAFFPVARNGSDPRHGYPVTGRGGARKYRPPKAILDLWLKSGRINNVTYERLMTGRI